MKRTPLIVLMLAATLACSAGSGHKHLRKTFNYAAGTVIDALERANAYRDNGVTSFEPRYLAVEASTGELQGMINHNDPVEERIFSEIVSCTKDLKLYREALTRNDFDLTRQSADIIETCMSTARKSFNEAQ